MRTTVKKYAFLLLGFLVACLMPFTGAAVLQDRLLYFPEKAKVADMLSDGLQAWPSRREFRGLLAEPPGPARGTIVVFHGNAGHAGHRSFYATELTRLGFRVILAEYPGYGPRDGAFGEKSLVGDAEETIARIHGRYGPPLLVVGESLGAAVAAEAGAHQRDKVAGLLLITPWDRLENVASHHYAWLPVKWFLRDPYDSAANLAGFTGPVLVAVAERDNTVPAPFGRALYEGLAPPKRLAVILGAGHDDWPDHVDEGWWRRVLAFVLGNPG
ncbi:MAG: alpha/beta hydrolase [Rhodocyclaceae bacterium]|nr:alpha/beta hydrolase [Rhodocyclaceae bacterium]